jgi:hypothetical protein
LHAGFLQKAKMALWVARHNNKSKLFCTGREILDDFISSALSLSGCWGLGSSLILKGRCLVAAQNPHILERQKNMYATFMYFFGRERNGLKQVFVCLVVVVVGVCVCFFNFVM